MLLEYSCFGFLDRHVQLKRVLLEGRFPVLLLSLRCWSKKCALLGEIMPKEMFEGQDYIESHYIDVRASSPSNEKSVATSMNDLFNLCFLFRNSNDTLPASRIEKKMLNPYVHQTEERLPR